MASVIASSWQPELLEREREVAELQALMKEARDGAGTAALIEAAAGLGKTRLLQRLRRHAGRAGMRVLSARATELEREYPYGVVRQLFEPLLAGAGESERAALLDGAAAAARPALGLARDATPSQAPGDLSFSTLYGLYWLTVNAAGAGPLLLAVDDAHWADVPSLQFLMVLAARLEGLPILLAVTSRPADVDDRGPLPRLAADPAFARISPAPLGLESVAKLLGGALGSPPEAAFSSACHELTAGNPFLLAELARTLAAQRVTPTAANASAVRDVVPGTIARAVLVRLAGLPAPARALAQAVVILGDGSETRLAAALSGLESPAAADAADALRRADILEPEPPLRFVHPLVRNAVYAEIPAGARSREHERAAALLAGEGMPLGRIAIHLLATDPAGNARVSQALCDAARAALDQAAPEPAIAYLRRALEEPPPAAARQDVLELLVTAGFRAADASATAGFEAELVDGLMAEPERLVRSGVEVAAGLIATGQAEEGARLLERAIDAAERAGNLAAAVAMEAQLPSFTQLPPVEARERFERYEGRLSQDSPEQRVALALRSWWSSLTGDPASEAADLARRALADGRILAEHPDSLASGQAILALTRAGELDLAEKAAERLIEIASARGAIGALAGGWFLRGCVEYRRGELKAAEADARQAVELGRLRGLLGVFVQWSTLLIDVLAERDELDASERELELSGMAGEVPDTYWFGPVLFSRGKLRLAQGRARESVDDLLELRDRMTRWGIVSNPGSPAGAYAGLALAALGEREQARALAEDELARARSWGAPSLIGESMAALGVVTGGDRGLDLLGEAVALLEPTPARLLHAMALTELGTLLRSERRRSDAREPLRAGLDLARRCGGVALARRAAAELEATGERVPRYTPIGLEALTPSERRVAEMAARGMTNREIAAALYVTIKTVEGHLAAAYDKLGIRSRRELGATLGATPPQ